MNHPICNPLIIRNIWLQIRSNGRFFGKFVRCHPAQCIMGVTLIKVYAPGLDLHCASSRDTNPFSFRHPCHNLLLND